MRQDMRYSSTHCDTNHDKDDSNCDNYHSFIECDNYINYTNNDTNNSYSSVCLYACFGGL